MKPQENTTFANRYQLERLLGHGGFSEVWLAKDNYTKLNIAIKVYAPGQGLDSDGLAEFSAELAGVFNLNHTNLLKPTHVDTWEGMPYLILPYCSRGSISKQIGRMPENEIWKLIHDVASGLAYLHKNDIVHQDIKPDNILLDDAGNYVITDFGISTKARSTLRKSVIGGAVSGGTMAYMGPERFSKQPAPIKASDIWSFGAMVYELITGNVPFGEMGGGMQKAGAEIPEISEPISNELRHTIEKMLALNTWDRPTAERLTGIAQSHKIEQQEYPSNKSELSMTNPSKMEIVHTHGRATLQYSGIENNKVNTNNTRKITTAADTVHGTKRKYKWCILGFTVLIALIILCGYSYFWKPHNARLDDVITQTESVIPDNFVLIPGGILSHYQDKIDPKTQKPVYIDISLDSFYIGQYEVMQKEYTELMPDNPSRFYGDSLPILGIDIAEAAIYCNMLSAKYGYDGFYTIQDDSIAVNPRGNGFRLPTQYEWAYAARDRKDNPYKYASGNELNEIAWYGTNSQNKPHVIGQKKPNEYGLYDMTGNAEEIVWKDSEKKITGCYIVGSYRLYNFASHMFSECMCVSGDWGTNAELGMRLVFIPRNGIYNSDITYSKKRKIVDGYMKMWERVNADELPYCIGRQYEYGYGVKQNIEEAIRWYQIGCNKGDKKASEKLHKINN